MSQNMTLEDIEQLLAAYGSKPENWPAEKADAMSALLQIDAQAAAIAHRAAALDAVLDSRLPAAPTALEQAILADMNIALGGSDILAFPQPSALTTGRIWGAATALAACFAAGFIAAPFALDFMTGSADLMASLDIISDAFLPTEPL